jgi:hypothetical protein
MRKLLGVTAAIVVALGGGFYFLPLGGGQAVAREAVVYKSPTCGCCKGWAIYLQRNGYKVTVIDRDDMDKVKNGMGVPEEMRSCHTAKIDGYVVEGHVPLEAIDKLLAEKPKATGIAAPGMPSGSPGMDGPKAPNPVYTFGGAAPRLLGTY